jgi:hypothetical protein
MEIIVGREKKKVRPPTRQFDELGEFDPDGELFEKQSFELLWAGAGKVCAGPN